MSASTGQHVRCLRHFLPWQVQSWLGDITIMRARVIRQGHIHLSGNRHTKKQVLSRFSGQHLTESKLLHEQRLTNDDWQPDPKRGCRQR